MVETSEIFEIKARRCTRCGGILTSKYGLQNGMGTRVSRNTTQNTPQSTRTR